VRFSTGVTTIGLFNLNFFADDVANAVLADGVTFFSARFVDNWADIVLSLNGYLFDRRLRSTTKLEKLWAMFFFFAFKDINPWSSNDQGQRTESVYVAVEIYVIPQ